MIKVFNQNILGGIIMKKRVLFLGIFLSSFAFADKYDVLSSTVEKYNNLIGHKALAVAVDESGAYSSAWADGYAQKDKAIASALRRCKKERVQNYVQSECILYMVDDKYINQSQNQQSTRNNKSASSHVTYNSNGLIGASLKNGAKFYGHKIWQDQKFNGKYDSMNYNQAKNYCESLSLLNINEWTLPSREDYIELIKDKKYQAKKFNYEAKRKGYASYYWTKDRNCYESNIMWTIKREECVYAIDLDGIYIKKEDTLSSIEKKVKAQIGKKSEKFTESVRCILNPNIYNIAKQEEATLALEEGGIDGYLKAFIATGNKFYIQKAISLAKSNKEKAKIEATLYNYLGGLKIFDIKANGKVISGDTKSNDVDTFLIKSIRNRKNLKQKFSVKLKRKTPLKLKYNKYIIDVEFRLKLKYCETMKAGYLSQTTCDDQDSYKKVTFNLSKKNNYSMFKVIDFGSVEQGGRTSALLFLVDKNLADAKIDYEIVSTKVINRYEK